jgi:uncharacterized protein (UPF0276 family)
VARLAVSDTPLSRSLLAAGELDVDALETTGPKTEGACAELPGVPLLLHNAVWDWSLGHPRALEQGDVMATTHARLARTGAPWLSVHVGFSAATVAYDDEMRPTSPRLGRDELRTAMIANVRELARRISVPLLLENLDLQPTGAYDHVCDPAFLRELLEATDTGLLLDLAHAQVSAARLGLGVDAYLADLPLQRVRQLHVSGPRWRNGVLHDAHETLRERDLALLREVLVATRPWALTLEYGRDADALRQQLATLRPLVAAAATD